MFIAESIVHKGKFVWIACATDHSNYCLHYHRTKKGAEQCAKSINACIEAGISPRPDRQAQEEAS
jgi:hypothetical protein